MSIFEALVLLVVPVVLIVTVTVTVTESRRLRDVAQRLRELEDEQVDGWEPLDALPEFDTVHPMIRMPDGEITDAGPVLRDTLRELRAWPPNRRPGRPRT